MSQVSLDFRNFSLLEKCASSKSTLSIDESPNLITPFSRCSFEGSNQVNCESFNAQLPLNPEIQSFENKQSSKYEVEIINYSNVQTYGHEKNSKNDSSKVNDDFDSFISNWSTDELFSKSNMKIVEDSKNGFSGKFNTSEDDDYDWSDIAALCDNAQKKNPPQNKSSNNAHFDSGNTPNSDFSDFLSSVKLDTSKSSNLSNQIDETDLQDLATNCLDDLSINKSESTLPSASKDSIKSTETNLSDWLSSLEIVDSIKNGVNENFAKCLTDLTDGTCGSFEELNGCKIREYKRNVSNSESNSSDSDSAYHSGPSDSPTGTISIEDKDAENGLNCPETNRTSNNDKFSFFNSSPDSFYDFKSYLSNAGRETCRNTPSRIQKSNIFCDVSLFNSAETEEDANSIPTIDLSACIKKPSYPPESVPSALSDNDVKKDVEVKVRDAENTPIPVFPVLLVSRHSTTKRPNVKSSLFAKALACTPKAPSGILKKINNIKTELRGSLFLRPECGEIPKPKGKNRVIPTYQPVLTHPGRRFFGVPPSYEVS